MKQIIKAHLDRYPLSEPRDLLKLCYQSEFGPEHLVEDGERVQNYIRTEWKTATVSAMAPEDIGNGLVRFHLTGEYDPEIAAPLLRELFLRTAREHKGTPSGLEERLKIAGEFALPGTEEAFAAYRAAGCPPVRHSETYREAYQPHYRLLTAQYGAWFPSLYEITETGSGIIAVDGLCGSGKTTFAELLSTLLPCNVIHMDDFYLPITARGENWRQLPAGNMDLSRLIREVLEPLKRGAAVSVRPFSCQTGSFGEERVFSPKPLTVIEGSYSHHPMLREFYDKMYFLSCPEEKRLRRLRAREGDYFKVFQSTWIPMEKLYLAAHPSPGTVIAEP